MVLLSPKISPNNCHGGNCSNVIPTMQGSNTLYFAYDASGVPMSVTYGNATYYYITNVQGDVTGILNSDGALVVSYTYDAWGNQLSCTGDDAATLGTYNPLRYRGYVYDQGTGLYYLQSRYYNPEIGRFINADAFAATGQGLLGNNMFTYCHNSIVSKQDPFGMWTMGVSIGANITVFFGASVNIGVFWDDNGNVDWQWSYALTGVNNTNHIGALDVGAGIALQYTNRKTVYDLYGPATYVGASGGSIWYVGADAISFADASDLDAQTDGVQITGGIGIGVDLHIVESYTKPVGRKENTKNKILTFKEKRLGKC